MSSLCRAVALKHMMRATTRRHLLRALSVLLLAIPSAQGGVQEILAHRAHQNLEGRAAGQGGGLGTTAVGLCFRVGLAGGGGPGEAVLGCAGLRQSLEEGGLEERATLRLRGGYTPKKSRKSQSKRKPLKLKYKIVKKVAEHHRKQRREARDEEKDKKARRAGTWVRPEKKKKPKPIEQEVEESIKLRRIALEQKMPGKPKRPSAPLF
ncbi:hypothetical protein T484DRAFT_1941114 [Baffinella frigidus]|nr:hypothetical protein T484DRAFT_1941114 [Cryptophyta sp. CCMP2293]